MTMGQSAEKMAKENGISREAQDRFALALPPARRRRHRRRPPHGGDRPRVRAAALRRDRHVGQWHPRRYQLRPARLAPARLRPAVRHRDRRERLSLTDGRRPPCWSWRRTRPGPRGFAPLAVIRSYAGGGGGPGQTSCSMRSGLSRSALRRWTRAGTALKDRLARPRCTRRTPAQALSNAQAFESLAWAERRLGRSEPLGEVDWDATNVMGGSIAIGHPFGATGARLVTKRSRTRWRRRGVRIRASSRSGRRGGMGFANGPGGGPVSGPRPIHPARTRPASPSSPRPPRRAGQQVHDGRCGPSSAPLLDALRRSARCGPWRPYPARATPYSAGADIEEFVALRTAAEATRLARMARILMERSPPSQTVVGRAIITRAPASAGGLELALALSLPDRHRPPEDSTRQPEVQPGSSPAPAGSNRLPRLVGLRGPRWT